LNIRFASPSGFVPQAVRGPDSGNAPSIRKKKILHRLLSVTVFSEIMTSLAGNGAILIVFVESLLVLGFAVARTEPKIYVL
jgi:hypothetical protein